MAIIEPHLSPEFLAELDRAAALRIFCAQTFPDTIIPKTDRVSLFAAKTHLIFDLFGGLLHLFHAGGIFDGAAMALVRPIVENGVSAQWLQFCARDETFAKAYLGEEYSPGLSNMMDGVDRFIGEPVHAHLKSGIQAMHEFTHGGLAQVARRFDAAGDLRSTYTDGEKTEAVRATGALFALVSSLFCRLVSTNINPTNDARAVAIEAEYVELYGDTK